MTKEDLSEYEDILSKIHSHNLQFLGLIDLPWDAAIEKIKKLKYSTYSALKSSVDYHAGKPFLGIQPQHTEHSEFKVQRPVTGTITATDHQEATPETDYNYILDVNSIEANIDPKYIPIRTEYLKALEELEGKPGCSGCQRGKLRRKFLEKLIALDHD